MPQNFIDWLDIAKRTDVGMRRANNQDALAVVPASDAQSWTTRGHVFLVADGMGAHAAGELASKMAADGIPHAYHKQPDQSQPEAIRKAIEEINSQIYHRGQANAEFQGMGTTASVLVLLPQGAIVAHVGDSRVYRFRRGSLQQLTFDHSLVWEMMAAGHVSQQAVPNFIPKNIITRSLGPQAQVQVDLEGPFPLEVGDTFLLCSDGLTGQLKDDEIGAILASVPPAEAAAVLVDLANLRGGPDNITLLVVKVVAEPPAAYYSSEGIKLASELRPRPPSNPFPSIIGIALVLLAVGLLFFQEFALAGGSLLLGIGMIVVPMLRRIAAVPEPEHLPAGVLLGKGPYTNCECDPSAKTVDGLAQVAEQLKDAATDGQWSVNQDAFNAHCQRAVKAREAKDYTLAVREYASAMRTLMTGVRSQPRPKVNMSDSIDLTPRGSDSK